MSATHSDISVHRITRLITLFATNLIICAAISCSVVWPNSNTSVASISPTPARTITPQIIASPQPTVAPSSSVPIPTAQTQIPLTLQPSPKTVSPIPTPAIIPFPSRPPIPIYPREPISPVLLTRLKPILIDNNLQESDVITRSTVTLALPELNQPSRAVLLSQSAPLALKSITDTTSIGVLGLWRPLTNTQTTQPITLASDIYLVKKINENQAALVRNAESSMASNVPTQIVTVTLTTLKLSRSITTPETITTYKDTCYALEKTQYCIPISPMMELTSDEKTAIFDRMKKTVQQLANRGKLIENEINVSGTMLDLLPDPSGGNGGTSILAAPTYRSPFFATGEPINGALLGAIEILSDMNVPYNQKMPKGAYAVRTFGYGKFQWMARLIRSDGFYFDVPAQYIEIRGRNGQPEEHLAIVRDFCFGNFCFPWW